MRKFKKNRTIKQIKASKQHSKRMKGKGNSMYGKHHSLKTKIKIGLKLKIRMKDPKNNPNYKHGETLKKHFCIDCGKELSDYRKKKCRKCYYKYVKLIGIRAGRNNPMYGVHRFGKDNPNFKHGKCYEPYPTDWSKILKESIRKRDNYQCQICGKTKKKNGRALDIHHIDYNKKNLNLENLISLCHSCHVQTNGNREIYMEYFKVLLNIL